MSNQIITSELLKDDPDLIDLVVRFISRLPAMQDAITKAYEKKDWETFSSLIHQMKGVAGNYGYPMLTSLSVEIEALAKEKNFSKLKSKLDEFYLLSKNILASENENHKIAESCK